MRKPSHPTAQKLITQTGPLVAPSANSSGRPSPTKPQHVKEDFGQNFPVIEGGETQIGLESTVLDVSSQPFCIYRPGAISAQQIEEIIGEQVKVGAKNTGNQTAKSPGTKYSHYSPQATVKWLEAEENFDSEDTLYLLHSVERESRSVERELSSRSTTGAELPKSLGKADSIIHYAKDYQKMAHQLFDRFRQADHQGYGEIRVEPFTETQLKQIPIVVALQNRISKAVG